jgi:predicted RNA-binding Zn-ribbon protein involved in translation (DUF1610 family)
MQHQADPEPADAPRDAPMVGRCPNCRKDEWTAAAPGTVAGLQVRPYICDICGFIALLHDPDAR